MVSRSAHREDGLTLIETLFAILILTISFASLASTFTTGLKGIKAMRETSFALQAVQEEMETMRDSPFGAIQTHSFPVPSLNTNGTVVVQQEGADLKKVTINVAWLSGSSRSMNTSVVTRIAKDGIDRQ